MALNDAEKAAIRYHLGYPQVDQSIEISLGVIDASQPLFVVEAAMQHVLVSAEPRVRRAIQQCDCYEDRMDKAGATMEAQRTGGGVHLRGPDAMRELEEQYLFWCNQLANTIGAPINPLSLTHNRLGAGHSAVVEPT